MGIEITNSYQNATEEAGTRTLLFTDNASTGHAVIDEVVFLSQTLARMTSW